MIFFPATKALALASATVFGFWAGGPASAASDVETTDTAAEAASGVWYADNSCRLRVGAEEHIGVTAIDADMDQDAARTLIHCDSDSGTRLTLMVVGSALTLGERRELDARDALDNPVDAKVAWISQIAEADNQDTPAEHGARRYLASGQVIIRETPGVNTVDSTLHADRQAFAEIDGLLEPDYYQVKLDEQESRNAPDDALQSPSAQETATDRYSSRLKLQP